MHPYPRKLVIPDAKEMAYVELTGSKLVQDEEDNRSPRLVLSAHGSDGLGSKICSNSPNSSSAELPINIEQMHNDKKMRLVIFSCKRITKKIRFYIKSYQLQTTNNKKANV